MSAHPRAVLQALFVSFLWSTSWVLIKTGLEEVPPLTFAGLRYMLAFICLLAMLLRPDRAVQRQAIRQLSGRDGFRLVLLGVLFYTVAQSAQYLGLDRLPAITTSLLLSFTTVVVALLGIVLLDERPTWRQWGGIALYLSGALLYFYPVSIPARQVVGLGIVLVGVMANALSTILGRGVNRTATLPPLVVTVISMGIGAILMLAAGIIAQGLPTLSLQSWAIVAWLAVVNTAFAFTLWNHTQRTLSAVESSIINNTMMIQIAILAWVFLDERLDAREIVGLVLAAVGTFIVQFRRAR